MTTAAPLLTLLTLTPLAGAAVVACLPQERRGWARRIALLFSLAVVGLAARVALGFRKDSGEFQWVERWNWVPALGVHYHLGIDGLGLAMVLLTAFLVPFSLMVWTPEGKRASLYCSLVLALEAGLMGAFTALNFFHWFLFWELSLIPAFFLIKLWGGPGRSAAATQFFVYTMGGSVALLLAFLALHTATGEFDFPALAVMASDGRLDAAVATRWVGPGWLAGGPMQWIFAGVLLGLAVKVPLMPFHTWLPGAYAEAPSGVTMLLTGALSKMGVYGLLRLLLPIFPEQLRAWHVPLLGFALLTVVAGAAAALAQTDLKRLLAYSSVNHLGYCFLGVFAVAGPRGSGAAASDQAAVLGGVILQMFNHGVTAAALFGFVALLERRTGGGCELRAFGGLREAAPVFTGMLGFAVFSSLGLPGLSGFVGEFLIFKGLWGLVPGAAAVAALGLLLTAVFLLTMMLRVFHGPLRPSLHGFADLEWGERLAMVPALGLMVLLGIWPQALMGWLNQTVVVFVEGLPW